MKERQQNSSNYPIGFMLVLKSDHITGATGKAGTLTLTISKNGAPFGPRDPLGTIVETGHGWYSWTSPVEAAGPSDRDTLGELKIHVDEASCDPYDEKYDIVSYDPFAAVSLPAAERTAMADAILTRDWFATAAAFVGTLPARCLLQGMRLLRNKWSIEPTTGILTVTAEDDKATAWQMQTASQAGADPIVGQTPTS
jgi:hypothetical protein